MKLSSVDEPRGVCHVVPKMNKSFLKWAGGKSQLLERILSLMPPVNSTARYIEPFVGSGVVALNVPHPSVIISDINPGLMSLWTRLQRGGLPFIEECGEYFGKCNTEKVFYEFRKTFNDLSAEKDKTMCMDRSIALLFLYLNRHCFNGLCRFNAKGQFNVPFGRYKNPGFPRFELINALMVTRKMAIYEQGFEQTMALAGENDVVYCDPPYIPISETSSFTAYSAGGFGMEQQSALERACWDACDRGATVIISNNDVPLARKLYAQATEIHEVQVAKRISCKADGRKKSGEIIAVYRPS